MCVFKREDEMAAVGSWVGTTKSFVMEVFETRGHKSAQCWGFLGKLSFLYNLMLGNTIAYISNSLTYFNVIMNVIKIC